MSEFASTIYRELHAIARNRLANVQGGHTLQPTALVNEAWIKLRGGFNGAVASPEFFKTAAGAMRQILIDHARTKRRLKRGGEARRDGRDVADIVDPGGANDLDQLLTLDDAVTRMERLDPQAAEVVKLRFFAGLSVEETAAALGVSERTVKRDWSFARAWLAKELATPA